MTMRTFRQRPIRREDRRELARDSTQLLSSLGSDPVAVAGSLESAGVRGEPADARQCALAVYFRAVMAGDPRVSGVRVFHDRLVIGSPGRLFTHRVGVSLPTSVRAFISGFDARHYPGLLRPAHGDSDRSAQALSDQAERSRPSVVS
jgi:hypothetical protein